MNDAQILTNLFSGTANLVSPATIIFNLFLALILALIISYVYQFTHNGLSYSKTLAFTIVFLVLISSIAMMVIGNSIARAFGLLGAFSIIRFRTAIKDTKDISYIFFALIVGMAIGTQSYLIAIISTIFLCILLFVLTKVNFGSMQKFDHIVTFTLNTEKAGTEAYQSVFQNFLKSNSLLNVNAGNHGKKLEFSFNIRFMDQSKTGEFVQTLEKTIGIEDVTLIAVKENLEY
ncbi:hypothetical protein A2483_04735 [Candidatus Peregrinibacteria bacterium RIFOXYC2_FULL_33_13]|nr:MAG: hypothetical protein UR27_C0030G0004 [Candidatus Peregrinibacteria bacterium GW2011_GWA2_33_10]KKP41135.1 MAG: hypothetical protein UR30_C0002G0169 [Candidatus Peregrinibacteria bacterium GW2011_GWC2_33_13]OGJ48851.1 MAG: hypothetical protein A2229_05085 [Candidatus Peregrinibacteria bacterium RIFOXYA2_FULL_33_7]OGJ54498.1 MAG: hypothetical protein A2483_04735 [Candidatus Peregrinibacteria bacterium RIFOXYC2_FULL_33_13]